MTSQFNELDLLLVGKTGNGKSATGNTILGRRAFTTSSSMSKVTETVEVGMSVIQGRVVRVVDSPGLCDTWQRDDFAIKQATEDLASAIASCPAGFHAFLLVCRFGQRFTDEDKDTIAHLKKIFGADFIKNHAILVVTQGDIFSEVHGEEQLFEDWCEKQKGAFEDMFWECRKRALLFDNKTSDETKKKAQVQKLVNMIDAMDNQKRYTNSMFEMAKAEREKLILSAKPTEEIFKEIGLLAEQLGKLHAKDPIAKLQRLTEMRERVASLEQMISKYRQPDSVMQISILVESLKLSIISQCERMEKSAHTDVDDFRMIDEGVIRQVTADLEQKYRSFSEEQSMAVRKPIAGFLYASMKASGELGCNLHY